MSELVSKIDRLRDFLLEYVASSDRTEQDALKEFEGLMQSVVEQSGTDIGIDIELAFRRTIDSMDDQIINQHVRFQWLRPIPKGSPPLMYSFVSQRPRQTLATHARRHISARCAVFWSC
jgi:hypothetical protein